MVKSTASLPSLHTVLSEEWRLGNATLRSKLFQEIPEAKDGGISCGMAKDTGNFSRHLGGFMPDFAGMPLARV